MATNYELISHWYHALMLHNAIIHGQCHAKTGSMVFLVQPRVELLISKDQTWRVWHFFLSVWFTGILSWPKIALLDLFVLGEWHRSVLAWQHSQSHEVSSTLWDGTSMKHHNLSDESQPFICKAINEEMLPASLHTTYNQGLVKALHESVIYFEFTLSGVYRGAEGLLWYGVKITYLMGIS